MFHSAGVVWLKVAVVYLVIGVGLGIAMGVSGNHTQFPTHAHINLLGWVSLALIGLIYRQFPHIAVIHSQRFSSGSITWHCR